MIKPDIQPTFVIVDDDDVDREVIRRALRKCGSTNPIVEAGDGAEALDILKGGAFAAPVQKPFVVILDLNMPRMNGFEFLDKIRRDPDIKNTPTFVLSTSNAAADKEKAYRRCISGYIVKSHENKSLAAAMAMLDQFQRVIAHPA